jgi:hypothetical protein
MDMDFTTPASNGKQFGQQGSPGWIDLALE